MSEGNVNVTRMDSRAYFKTEREVDAGRARAPRMALPSSTWFHIAIFGIGTIRYVGYIISCYNKGRVVVVGLSVKDEFFLTSRIIINVFVVVEATSKRVSNI